MTKEDELAFQNDVLTDEVLRLNKELKAERMTPEGMDEVGRVYYNLTEDNQVQVSFGFDEDRDDKEQIMVHLIFALMNIVRADDGKPPVGNLYRSDSKAWLPMFDEFFQNDTD